MARTIAVVFIVHNKDMDQIEKFVIKGIQRLQPKDHELMKRFS